MQSTRVDTSRNLNWAALDQGCGSMQMTELSTKWERAKQEKRWVARTSAKDGASGPLAVPWPQEALWSKNDKTAWGPIHSKGIELLPDICCGQLPLLGVTFQARFLWWGFSKEVQCHLPTPPPIADRKWMTRSRNAYLTVKYLAQILQYEEAVRVVRAPIIGSSAPTLHLHGIWTARQGHSSSSVLQRLPQSGLIMYRKHSPALPSVVHFLIIYTQPLPASQSN